MDLITVSGKAESWRVIWDSLHRDRHSRRAEDTADLKRQWNCVTGRRASRNYKVDLSHAGNEVGCLPRVKHLRPDVANANDHRQRRSRKIALISLSVYTRRGRSDPGGVEDRDRPTGRGVIWSVDRRVVVQDRALPAAAAGIGEDARSRRTQSHG